MNCCAIIGNLTRDPEVRTVATQNGEVTVCNFSVAVNNGKKDANGNNKADFFNVTAWRQMGENCYKFLAKGRKVFVMGPVATRVFTRNDNSVGSSLEITAEKVEFLSSRNDGAEQAAEPAPSGLAPNAPAAPRMDTYSNMTPVDMDELPF